MKTNFLPLLPLVLSLVAGCEAPEGSSAALANSQGKPVAFQSATPSTDSRQVLPQRPSEAENALENDYKELLEVREEGRWTTVQTLSAALAAKRKQANLPADALLNLCAAEALIELRRPSEAATLLNEEEAKYHDEAYTLVLHLAQAQLGLLNPAAALADVEKAMSYYPDAGVSAFPAVKGQQDLVACVRLARAVDAWFTGRRQTAEREARAVLTGQPRQAVAAHLLVKELRLQRRFDEADRYLEVASKMPGREGDEDRRMYNLKARRTLESKSSGSR